MRGHHHARGALVVLVLVLVSIGKPAGAAAQLPLERLRVWIDGAEAAIGACARPEGRPKAWFRSEATGASRAQAAPPSSAAWSACVERALETGRPRDLGTAYVWVTCRASCDAFGFLQDELDDTGLAWAIEEQLASNEALAACAAADSHVENLVVLLEAPLDQPRARYLGDGRGPLPAERAVGECYARAIAAHRFVRPAHYSGRPPPLRVELNPAIRGRPFHPPSLRVARDAAR